MQPDCITMHQICHADRTLAAQNNFSVLWSKLPVLQLSCRRDVRSMRDVWVKRERVTYTGPCSVLEHMFLLTSDQDCLTLQIEGGINAAHACSPNSGCNGPSGQSTGSHSGGKCKNLTVVES